MNNKTFYLTIAVLYALYVVLCFCVSLDFARCFLILSLTLLLLIIIDGK
nr:MAG TPA: hypothetical protein [Caudoviricetes sp.]